MKPVDPIAAAAFAAKQPPPQQKRVGPEELVGMFAQYFGLNAPTLKELMPNIATCMCGKCQGPAVQLEVRLHFPMFGGPEFIRRGDAARPAPDPAPDAIEQAEQAIEAANQATAIEPK